MKVNLRGPRDLGEIIRLAYRTYAAHFRALLLIALIAAPLQMLITVLSRRTDSEGADAGIAVLQFPAAFIGLIAAAALIHAIDRIASDATPDAGESLDTGFALFPAIFRGYMLLLVLVAASLFAFPFLGIWWLMKREATIDGRRDWWLVLPGVLTIYLALRWAFLGQAIVIDGKRNWGALDASADAVRASWWRVGAVLLVVFVVQLGPLMIASLARFGPTLVEALSLPLASALVLPFSITAHTLLYYDLKARANTDVSAA